MFVSNNIFPLSLETLEFGYTDDLNYLFAKKCRKLGGSEIEGESLGWLRFSLSHHINPIFIYYISLSSFCCLSALVDLQNVPTKCLFLALGKLLILTMNPQCSKILLFSYIE